MYTKHNRALGGQSRLLYFSIDKAWGAAKSANPMKKRHHILPRFYLDGFTDKEKVIGDLSLLYQYERKMGNPNPVQPKNAAVSKHFYSFRDRDGSIITGFEDILAKLEDDTAPLFRKIIARKSMLNPEEAAIFALFVMCMWLRTQRLRDIWHRLNIDFFEQHFIELAKDKDKFHKKCLDCEKRTGKPLGKDFEYLRKFVLSRNYDLKTNPTLSMQFITLHVPELAEILHRMQWAFLSRTSEQAFLTSDNPVVVINPLHAVNYLHAGLAQKDVEITFPLDSTMCFFAKWNCPRGFSVGPPALIRKINRRTACNARRFVYSPFQGDFIVKWLNEYDSPDDYFNSLHMRRDS